MKEEFLVRREPFHAHAPLFFCDTNVPHTFALPCIVSHIMARTKQKVRDEWQEKKRLLVEAQQAASGAASSRGAGPSCAAGDDAAAAAAARLRAQDEADEDNDDSASEGAEEEYKVDCIVSERIYRKQLEYKVKWEGFDDQTWEPAANLKNTSALEDWLAKAKEREEEDAEESADDDADDDEEVENSSDSDSSYTSRRKKQRKRKGDSDSSYKGSSESEEEEEDDGSDAEYVPEGGRGGRRGSKRARSAPAPRPLNSRQMELLEEDLANVSSLAALKAAVKAIVKAHPQAFATAREELQGCEHRRKLPSRRGRPAVVDESDDDDDGRNGDADQDDAEE